MTGTISIGGILSDTVRAYRLDPITLNIVMAIIMAVPVVLMDIVSDSVAVRTRQS